MTTSHRGIAATAATVLAAAASLLGAGPATATSGVDDSGAARQWCPSDSRMAVCYEMNDTDGGMADSAGPVLTSLGKVVREDRGVLSDSVRSAVPNTLFFTGWREHYDTATGALRANTATNQGLGMLEGEVRIDAESSAESARLNPSTQDGVPGAGAWSMGLRLRPWLVVGSAEPAGTAPHLPYPPTDCAVASTEQCPALKPSYNVLQRGRATTEGGMYKLEVMGHTSSPDASMPYQPGSVHCTFIDDDGTVVEAYSSTTLTKPRMYDVLCSRQGSSVRLDVRTFDQPVERSTGTMTRSGADAVLDSVLPGAPATAFLPGVGGSLISIGKKTDSENYGDAFTGWVDAAYLGGATMSLCDRGPRTSLTTCEG